MFYKHTVKKKKKTIGRSLYFSWKHHRGKSPPEQDSLAMRKGAAPAEAIYPFHMF